MKSDIQKAEAIRQLTYDTIREHGLVDIMDEDVDENNSYLQDIIKIIAE